MANGRKSHHNDPLTLTKERTKDTENVPEDWSRAGMQRSSGITASWSRSLLLPDSSRGFQREGMRRWRDDQWHHTNRNILAYLYAVMVRRLQRSPSLCKHIYRYKRFCFSKQKRIRQSSKNTSLNNKFTAKNNLIRNVRVFRVMCCRLQHNL